MFGDIVVANSGEGKIRFESVEFLRGVKVAEGVDHVALYIGGGEVLHATKVKGMVVKESLLEFKKTRTIVGYGRITEHLGEERYVVRVPAVRLDVRTKEDLVEEIGRIIGYDKITPTLPALAKVGTLSKHAHYESLLRSILLSHGFSEVITYTFGDEGEVALVKGLAFDKEKLRTSLKRGMLQSIALNLYNAPLLGKKVIKIFEIGSVFTYEKETRHLAIMIDDGAKKTSFTEEVDLILSEIKRALNVEHLSYDTFSVKPYGVEIDIDALIATLDAPTTYEASLPATNVSLYKTVSPYPFITRDVAMWVPDTVSWESILSLCNEVHNPLVVRTSLFDTFSKEIEGIKKTSYAFRLVFQSHEKTLTDEEVNAHMEHYYELFRKSGYEVR